MTSTAGGGGQPHVDACGRGGGGGVEQVYDVRMVCFLEHNATVPHWILDSISDGKLQEITRTSNIIPDSSKSPGWSDISTAV